MIDCLLFMYKLISAFDGLFLYQFFKFFFNRIVFLSNFFWFGIERFVFFGKNNLNNL